ncbi:MAG: NUDIX domain-containing protein [Verrucomicrobia bacterium]|nr:NUDIX domain-containing protein [Verrucomicrobiota bacterium]
MTHIRTAARALIIEDDKLLLIKMCDSSGTFYILPGGGQNHGETLHQSLAREAQEEIGVPVEIGAFAYIREYIGRNHEFRASHSNFHQVECVFHCSLKTHNGLGTGTEHDKKQIGIEWIPLSAVQEHRILPKCIKSFFTSSGFVTQKAYLGDTN